MDQPFLSVIRGWGEHHKLVRIDRLLINITEKQHPDFVTPTYDYEYHCY